MRKDDSRSGSVIWSNLARLTSVFFIAINEVNTIAVSVDLTLQFVVVIDESARLAF